MCGFAFIYNACIGKGKGIAGIMKIVKLESSADGSHSTYSACTKKGYLVVVASSGSRLLSTADLQMAQCAVGAVATAYRLAECNLNGRSVLATSTAAAAVGAAVAHAPVSATRCFRASVRCAVELWLHVELHARLALS
eukprot:scpid68460/ scgid13388/ 